MSRKIITSAAGALLWQRARLQFENNTETLKAIAEGLGITRYQLLKEAEQRGWAARKTKVKKTHPKPVSTQAILVRFRALLQVRLRHLEEQLQAGKSTQSSLMSDRAIRTMNTLVRTLEKLLELEQKDRNHNLKVTSDQTAFDDASREALAARIEKIQSEILDGFPLKTSQAP